MLIGKPFIMARQKAEIPRTTMKVPKTFRDSVREAAKSAGMDATVFLERCTVVRKDAREEPPEVPA